MANAGPDTNKSQVSEDPPKRSDGVWLRRGTFSEQDWAEGETVLYNVWKADKSRRKVYDIWKVRFVTLLFFSRTDNQLTLLLRVIDGVDSTLDAIERAQVNEKNRPLSEIRIQSVRLRSLSNEDCYRLNA